jgi:PAS domain S-box-containing protein
MKHEFPYSRSKTNEFPKHITIVIEKPNVLEQFELAAIVESSQDAIYSTDFDGTIVSWNRAAERIFGYAACEVIGRNISMLFLPADLNKETAIIEQIKCGFHVQSYETIRIKKDGFRVPISLTVSPIKNNHNDIIGISRIARDLTETQRDQSGLREKNNLINSQLSEIETLYRTAPIGLAYLDSNLRYVRVNDCLAEINGVAAEKHIGHTLREILPELLIDEVEPFSRSVLETGKPILDLEISGESIDRPGEERVCSVNYYPLNNQAGETVGVNVVVQEITERRQEQEKLFRSEQRLRGLIDNLFSFVGLLSPDGTVTEVNRTALVTSELKAEDVIGKSFPDTEWWTWSEDVQEQLRAAIVRAAKGETIRYDVVIKVGEDKFLPFDFQLAPMFDENGKVINLVPSGIDISERLQLEAKLKQAAQLAIAGELAAGLAHEIKNPLTGIQGAIDILIQRRNHGDEEREILENVRREVARIDDAVHLLLNRSRPRPMTLVNMSLNETVRRAILLANYQLATRHLKNRIKIETDLPKKTVMTAHDTAQIEDAVLNLIINAMDAVGDFSGRIGVRLRKQKVLENNTEEAVIEITDTGCGLSETQLANIFTPFYTTKENGNGLGLIAVKRIIAAHGGRCSFVESTIGRGSTFAIHLPVKLI